MNRKIDLKNAVMVLAIMLLMIVPFAFSVNAETTYYADEDCVTGYVVPSDGSGFITLVSYNVRVYYLDPVKVIGEDEDSYCFMYDGKEYSLPKTEITFDKPVYTVPNSIAQEIINEALTYAPYNEQKKTWYDYGYTKKPQNKIEYCGIYGPWIEDAYGFTCKPYIETVINKVMRKRVPTYSVPFGTVEDLRNFNSAVYNKNCSQKFEFKEISLSSIEAGDIIIFDQDGDGEAEHCGIYLGYPDDDTKMGDYIHCAYRGNVVNQSISGYKRVYEYGGVMINHLDSEKTGYVVKVIRPYPETIKPINKTMYATWNRFLYTTMDGAKSYGKGTEGKDYVVAKKNDSMVFLYTTAPVTENEADLAYVKYNGKYYFTPREPKNDSGQLLITPQGMANCTFKLSASTYTYSGSEKKPTVTVKYGSKTLTKGTHYTVSYSYNKSIGKARVKVSGNNSNRYYGTKTLYFTIKPATPSKVSLKRASRTSIKVNWTPVKGSVTGYEIRYSTSSSMSGAKTAYVKGGTARTKTLKSLKSGKKYYVRVRAYKTVSGTRYYSSWSSTKYVK